MSEIYRQYESAAAQCADADGLLELQKKLLLPIIAEEKEAFISAEFGRLQQIMGVEYTDGEESYPQDVARLELIARMYENLMIGRSCADADAKTLLDGHAEYMDFKDGGKVVVIK